MARVVLAPGEDLARLRGRQAVEAAGRNRRDLLDSESGRHIELAVGVVAPGQDLAVRAEGECMPDAGGDGTDGCCLHGLRKLELPEPPAAGRDFAFRARARLKPAPVAVAGPLPAQVQRTSTWAKALSPQATRVPSDFRAKKLLPPAGDPLDTCLCTGGNRCLSGGVAPQAVDVSVLGQRRVMGGAHGDGLEFCLAGVREAACPAVSGTQARSRPGWVQVGEGVWQMPTSSVHDGSSCTGPGWFAGGGAERRRNR